MEMQLVVEEAHEVRMVLREEMGSQEVAPGPLAFQMVVVVVPME